VVEVAVTATYNFYRSCSPDLGAQVAAQLVPPLTRPLVSLSGPGNLTFVCTPDGTFPAHPVEQVMQLRDGAGTFSAVLFVGGAAHNIYGSDGSEVSLLGVLDGVPDPFNPTANAPWYAFQLQRAPGSPLGRLSGARFGTRTQVLGGATPPTCTPNTTVTVWQYSTYNLFAHELDLGPRSVQRLVQPDTIFVES
jgi:hypothetical protein